MRIASPAVVVLVCAACGGGSSSPASVNGYSAMFDTTFSDNSHVTGSLTANKCTALTLNIGGVCT